MTTLMAMLSIVLFIAIISLLYKSYIPVLGLTQCSDDILDSYDSTVTVLDVRDYNISYKLEMNRKINIPLPYLKRYSNDIIGKQLIVVTSNNVGKNVSIRFLRKKGFEVIGYLIIVDTNKFDMREQITVRRCCHEI
ncbi:hypothetical protein ACERII_06725 [Evansella sp. AB-rgal1]|uniref:hypothetical protein n=1 Tax=Evansella sp. AB-rgal1 TaxID=3242696 RepID=UPI00359E31A8